MSIYDDFYGVGAGGVQQIQTTSFTPFTVTANSTYEFTVSDDIQRPPYVWRRPTFTFVTSGGATYQDEVVASGGSFVSYPYFANRPSEPPLPDTGYGYLTHDCPGKAA